MSNDTDYTDMARYVVGNRLDYGVYTLPSALDGITGRWTPYIQVWDMKGGKAWDAVSQVPYPEDAQTLPTAALTEEGREFMEMWRRVYG